MVQSVDRGYSGSVSGLLFGVLLGPLLAAAYGGPEGSPAGALALGLATLGSAQACATRGRVRCWCVVHLLAVETCTAASRWVFCVVYSVSAYRV